MSMRYKLPHELVNILKIAIQLNVSDIWFASNREIYVRKSKIVTPLSQFSQEFNGITLTNSDIEGLFQFAWNEIKSKQELKQSADFSIKVDETKFRVCFSCYNDGYVVTLRLLPPLPEDFSKFNIPEFVVRFAHKPNGLLLVTGPTGSGKTTTLAFILEEINKTRYAHIITLEDPIEFEFKNKKSIFTQKQVGRDIESFSHGLRSALRENPDVILVGEIRDLETARLAMEAANTGHLVLATVHTKSCYETVNRILNIFPGEEKDFIRDVLADCLVGVISQVIMPKKDKTGVTCFFEMFESNLAIRNIIKKNNLIQLKTQIMQGSGILFEDTLTNGIIENKIDIFDALRYVNDYSLFVQKLKSKGMINIPKEVLSLAAQSEAVGK